MITMIILSECKSLVVPEIMHVMAGASFGCRSHDSPLHHRFVHRRPRHPGHLYPLVPLTGLSDSASMVGHYKNYTNRSRQPRPTLRSPAHGLSHSQPLTHHRQSLSHVMSRFWRNELYNTPDVTSKHYNADC